MISLQQTLFSMVKNWKHSPKIRNKTRVSTFTNIIQHSSGSPSYSNQRRKRNKRNPDWKRLKLSLFEDDKILYIENPKDSIRKLLELISEFRRLQDTKPIHRNHLHFDIITVKNQKEKLRNQSHSPLQQKELSI